MKCILWLAVVVFLLCGCTVQPPEQTVQPSSETISATEGTARSPGIYAPDSDVQASTGGAVRCYIPDLADVYGIRLVNGDVLVFSGADQTTLTRYTGENLVRKGSITLECRILPEDSALHIGDYGVTYYDDGANALVYLDNDLKEVSRLKLDPGLMGKPVLSADRTLVYYCTAEAVRVYDTATGLDRMLKSIAYPAQSAEGLLLNDSVLRCTLTDERGGESSLFLSTRTGETLAQLNGYPEISASEDLWCVRLQEGLLEQVIFGRTGETEQMLSPRDAFGKSWVLPGCSGVVTVSAGDRGSVLELYDLETGKRSAGVELPEGILLRYVEGIPGVNAVYLLALDEHTLDKVILRWDYTPGSAGDETVYTGPRYTAGTPDEAGLSRCAEEARSIGGKYGVTILTGMQAAETEPEDYTLEYEHQPAVLQWELAVLEEALSRFPEGFFAQLPGEVNICILRSITGNAQTGSVARARGIQFWDGERAFVALEAGDELYSSFFHELFHIIDSYVLSTTRVYYHWENQNPEGCEYFLDFTSYLTADVSEYLEDESRAFIDAYSMSYPREDRARIMEYACTEGNERYFRSEIMQSKLRTLCEGIREAFGMEKYQGDLLWEQYLTEPLKMK